MADTDSGSHRHWQVQTVAVTGSGSKQTVAVTGIGRYSNKLLQQGYRYHKLRKTFSKFYRRHYELVSKFNVGLKTLLHQSLSEAEFYGDLIYKFKTIVGRADFSDQLKKLSFVTNVLDIT